MYKIEKKKKLLKFLESLSDNDIQILERLNKCNKQAKIFIKDLIKLNPYFWDYGFLLHIEYSYLKEMRKTLLEEHLFVNCNRVCEQIQTCLNLLDIIQGNKSSINIILGKVNLSEDIDKSLKEVKYEIKKYVNIKNASRFIKDIKAFENMKNNAENGKALAFDMLYNIKAWKLYNKMKEYFMQNWWS